MAEVHQAAELAFGIAAVDGFGGHSYGVMPVLRLACRHESRRRIHQNNVALGAFFTPENC
jgi:hypothetical protein